MSYQSSRTITTKQTIYFSDGSVMPQTVVRETTYSQRPDGSHSSSEVVSPTYSTGLQAAAPIGWATPAVAQLPYPSADFALPYSGGIRPAMAAVQNAVTGSQTPGSIIYQTANSLAKGQSLFPQSKSFSDIKAECLRANKLWEDPDFPAIMSSVYSRQQLGRSFEWKRPNQICNSPVFISNGVSRFDVVQGELGDCWLLAAVANITLNQDLVNRIMPQNPPQNFDKGNYCGAFRFMFWYYGEWREIVVDDRLPTYNGRLIFMHSNEQNEFWSALLEKAYAKLVGSYENLKGGSTCESMTDFTGGFCETFELREKAPKGLLQIMLKAYERKSLMGCSLNPKPGQLEAQLSNGLVCGHAYSVTAVKLISLKVSAATKMPLVRIRNPWGNTTEWKGAWSDHSREWSLMSDTERKELGITFDSDGEFWMTYQDFVSNFETLEICHIALDMMSEANANQRFKWETVLMQGEWRRRVNAGGCRNYLQSFWTNPQYRITVTDPDDKDDDNMCTVLIGLLQKDRRKQRTQGFDYLTIGFSVYQLKDPNCGPLDMSFFERNASIARTTFINLREVSGRFKLPPGHYCVIPSTFEPGIEGEFVTRIYTEKPNTSNEINEKTAIVAPTIVVPPPTAVESKALNDAAVQFRQISGEDAEVDAGELLQILNNTFAKDFQCSGFTLETARSIVALKDKDMSGKLNISEFSDLWEELRMLKKSFQEKDIDRSGKLQSIELREALKSCGFRMNNQTLKALVMRYADKQGNVDFDDFICCAVRLKAMINKFQTCAGRAEALIASMSIDDFILTTMYC